MRVAFLGNDPWSVAPLHALVEADGIDVDLVVTNPPRPAGRGSKLTPTAVADAARGMALEVFEVAGVRGGEGFDALDRLEPDALVVVAYGEILSPGVLDIPRLAAVNVHFSLLPRWRGAAPVQHAILAGDEVTGVTVMLMDEGMDTGPILATEETTIGQDEDAGTLGQRLSELGGPLLVAALRGLEEGSIEPRSQDHAAATSAPKLRPEDRTIDWSRSSDEIVRQVRALAPEPGATTMFRSHPLKVLKARAQQISYAIALKPERGRIGIDSADGTPAVDMIGSIVRLLEVVPAGR